MFASEGLSVMGWFTLIAVEKTLFQCLYYNNKGKFIVVK